MFKGNKLKIIKIDNLKEKKALLKKIDVSNEGIKILEPKMSCELFYIQNLKTPAGNILKQDALSIGGDLAVSKDTICCKSETIDALLIVTSSQLKKLIVKMETQPFGLKELSKELKLFTKKISFSPKIMGIINANSDSFYQKSRFSGKEAIEEIEKMIEEGASIIDLGGVSSRPNSEPVSKEEELKRVKPIIDIIYSQKLFERVKFSLDSYQPEILKYALERGFSIINDITGLRDDRVCEVAKEYKAEVVIMHMQKNPKIMQNNPTYKNVILDIEEFFKERIEKAKNYNIEKIILDVGIGFGKKLNHNLQLISYLSHFKKFGFELLIGASRKSMIDKIYPSKIEERLAGTLAIHLKALENGASIIRCHDVKEHSQAIKVYQTLNSVGV